MKALDLIAPAMELAALYVQTNGCYSNLPGVDAWDEKRDARSYKGPMPVVAHPPCARWGRFAKGSPATSGAYTPGDDRGCFAHALNAVRTWGGVLEHPRDSLAWDAHHLNKPPYAGGWITADLHGGWTCCVFQGHYGHAAQKPSWLYACKTELPSLKWGPSDAVQHPTSPRRGILETMSKRQRAATPIEFRDLLLSIAATAIGKSE